MSRLQQATYSPYLNLKADNPPTGAHLAWFTLLSQALLGANAAGTIYTVISNKQTAIGSYKAIGGTVHCDITLPDAGTYAINLPGDAMVIAPCILSDGQIVWCTTSSLTITTKTANVVGQLIYKG